MLPVHQIGDKVFLCGKQSEETRVDFNIEYTIRSVEEAHYSTFKLCNVTLVGVSGYFPGGWFCTPTHHDYTAKEAVLRAEKEDLAKIECFFF